MKGVIVSENIEKRLAKDMQHFLFTAGKYAKNNKEPEIRVTHLVYAIIVDNYPNSCVETLEGMKVDINLLIDSLEKERMTDGKHIALELNLSIELKNIFERGIKKLKAKEEYDSISFFTDILRFKNELSDVFIEHAIDYKVFKETYEEDIEKINISESDMENITDELQGRELEMQGAQGQNVMSNNMKQQNELLSSFGEILNDKYVQGKLSPCFGREDEILKIERILNRKNKKNVLLIGGAGVGKTNIVEGLVEKIVNGKVSKPLLNSTVYALDINSIISGSIYRGQAEERLKTIINICVNQNYILFIDEAHLMTTYGNGGNIDIVNTLKPLMARGDIQVIAATTNAEYKKYMEKDKALVRRFGIEYIQELDKESTLKVLNFIKKNYEEAHNVIYSENVLSEIVEYTDKFIKNKKNPDKSIELMDDIGAKCKTKKYSEPGQILQLREELLSLKSKKIEIRDNNLYHLAESVVRREKDILKTIKKESKKEDALPPTKIERLSEFTDILQSKKGVDYMRFLSHKETKIKETVKGQDETISTIIRDLKSKYFFLDLDENKPLCYYFMGNTGTGKTFLTKIMAKEIFDNKIFEIEGEDYKEPHTIANLIGSPKGYIGSESGSALYEYVKENPECMIVINEMEKAHPMIYDFFLTLMDEGKKVDKDGMINNFQNAMIIFTSNIGTQKLNINPIGFGNIVQNKKDVYDKEMRSHFKPEFLNRLTNTFIFNDISEDVFAKILDDKLAEILKYAEGKNVPVEVLDVVKQKILKDCNEKKYGIRELNRQINKEIKTEIMEQYEKRVVI